MLAMHVPKSGIYTLLCFLCAPTTLLFSSEVKKKSVCSCFCCRGARIGLFKTLRLVLRCAVARHSLSLSCRGQGKKGMHDT